MKGPEAHEKDEIRKYLNSLAGCWHFAPYMAGFGAGGVPDRVGCHRGRFFAIEVKRPNKEPTPIQTRRMAEIEAASGKAFWGTADKVIPLFEEWIK